MSNNTSDVSALNAEIARMREINIEMHICLASLLFTAEHEHIASHGQMEAARAALAKSAEQFPVDG